MDLLIFNWRLPRTVRVATKFGYLIPTTRSTPVQHCIHDILKQYLHIQLYLMFDDYFNYKDFNYTYIFMCYFSVYCHRSTGWKSSEENAFTTWYQIYSRHRVTKQRHFPCYWPFVRGIHWSPVDSPRKGQWRGSLIFSLICAWTNGWANNHDACVLRRYRAHYDVTVKEKTTTYF